MIKFLLGVLFAVIIVVGGLYFLAMGTGAQDLGIKVSPQDTKNVISKIGTEIVPIKTGENVADFTLEGKHDVDLNLSSLEVSANANNRPWVKFPLKNVQVKIHDDGSLESSGIIVVAKALPYAESLGYSQEEIKSAMDKYHLPAFEVPYYASGTGSVANDQVNLQVSSLKIGAVPLPGSLVSQVSQEAKSVAEDLIQKHQNNFHIESLTFSQGSMHFKGQLPTKEYVVAP